MSDRIFIKGLAVHAHHGVFEHEGTVGQRFDIDLELDVDLASAARSDRLADTISYAAVAENALRAFTTRKRKLIEAAAGDVVEAIFAEFQTVSWVRIAVHKPHAPIAAIFADVGVVLERSRDGGT